MKYLGKKEARGLWGIKHTRKPVDDMVGLARCPALRGDDDDDDEEQG